MADRAEGKSKRGFASMDRERQKEIASKGGRAAHAKGTAHEFNSDEARQAGRKGGEVVSRNRDHMAEIGRKGGEARGAVARRAMRGTDEATGGLNAANAGRGENEVDLRDRNAGRADMGRERAAGTTGREGARGTEERNAGEQRSDMGQ